MKGKSARVVQHLDVSDQVSEVTVGDRGSGEGLTKLGE